MAGCDICEMIKRKESFKVIYEDEEAIAMLHEAPAFAGHTLVLPKQHCRIIEELPDELTSRIFNIANKISTALFESMNIQGTNILVNNGPEAGQAHAHTIINVIPRREDDGINMEWPMHKTEFSKLESTHEFLKDYVEKSVLGNAAKPETIEEKEEAIKSSDDDYMIRQLKRVP